MKIVVKFGGTSLASIERIRKAAEIIKNLVEKNHQVVVVASAMASATNELVEYTSYFHSVNNNKEYDTVLSSGEQISIGLLALALAEINLTARSLLAWQVPILTDNNHANAQITNIPPKVIEDLLNNNFIPVIAGFQGVTENYTLTTLGRGGSDTTATAIAAAIGADCCYIYTDVEGIYVCDPRLIKNPLKIEQIDYNAMIEMANSGAKVLHCRSIELAYKANVSLYVKSSFIEGNGTHIIKKENNLENPLISGIVLSNNEVMFKIIGFKNQQAALTLLNVILESGISIDMLEKEAAKEKINLTFVVSRDNFDNVNKIIKNQKNLSYYDNMCFNTEVAKISIIGIGVQTHPVIIQKMFQIIAKNDINILQIAMANLKVAVLVDEAKAKELVQALHEVYKVYFNNNNSKD